jgi:hypothetical protein
MINPPTSLQAPNIPSSTKTGLLWIKWASAWGLASLLWKRKICRKHPDSYRKTDHFPSIFPQKITVTLKASDRFSQFFFQISP